MLDGSAQLKFASYSSAASAKNCNKKKGKRQGKMQSFAL